ncbi:hypothetical protein VE03_02644 [Pseudogymnoascus sp. 23342-1-I1]|nr:hypothetical protein VE03_02644 [Pseudogymnoascus sp. 23342-1-I1]
MSTLSMGSGAARSSSVRPPSLGRQGYKTIWKEGGVDILWDNGDGTFKKYEPLGDMRLEDTPDPAFHPPPFEQTPPSEPPSFKQPPFEQPPRGIWTNHALPEAGPEETFGDQDVTNMSNESMEGRETADEQDNEFQADLDRAVNVAFGVYLSVKQSEGGGGW